MWVNTGTLYCAECVICQVVGVRQQVGLKTTKKKTAKSVQMRSLCVEDSPLGLPGLEELIVRRNGHGANTNNVWNIHKALSL